MEEGGKETLALPCGVPVGGRGNLPRGAKKKPTREFDMARYRQRHIALRMAYLGQSYHGLAVQENIPNTIEAALFAALLKTKLIIDRPSCNYSRCGRTDKGVSAFGQVVAFHLRSQLKHGVEFVPSPGAANPAEGGTDDLAQASGSIS
eukprot:RCo050147